MDHNDVPRRTDRRHSRAQIWEIGAVVHVGFLTLRVYGKELDCGTWRLESLGGARRYRFAPHHGLARISRVPGRAVSPSLAAP